jgi:hypothetical protein
VLAPFQRACCQDDGGEGHLNQSIKGTKPSGSLAKIGSTQQFLEFNSYFFKCMGGKNMKPLLALGHLGFFLLKDNPWHPPPQHTHTHIYAQTYISQICICNTHTYITCAHVFMLSHATHKHMCTHHTYILYFISLITQTYTFLL